MRPEYIRIEPTSEVPLTGMAIGIARAMLGAIDSGASVDEVVKIAMIVVGMEARKAGVDLLALCDMIRTVPIGHVQIVGGLKILPEEQ